MTAYPAPDTKAAEIARAMLKTALPVASLTYFLRHAPYAWQEALFAHEAYPSHENKEKWIQITMRAGFTREEARRWQTRGEGNQGKSRENRNAPSNAPLRQIYFALRCWWIEEVGRPWHVPSFPRKLRDSISDDGGERPVPFEKRSQREPHNDEARLFLAVAQYCDTRYLAENCYSVCQWANSHRTKDPQKLRAKNSRASEKWRKGEKAKRVVVSPKKTARKP